MSSIVKPMFASVIMGSVCYGSYKVFDIVLGNTLSTLLSVVVSMAVYFLIMLAVKGITEEDMRIVPAGGKLIQICKKARLIK